MVQQLRILAALAEGLGSVPSTHTTTCNSHPRAPDVLFCRQWANLTHTLTCTVATCNSDDSLSDWGKRNYQSSWNLLYSENSHLLAILFLLLRTVCTIHRLIRKLIYLVLKFCISLCSLNTSPLPQCRVGCYFTLPVVPFAGQCLLSHAIPLVSPWDLSLIHI